MFGFNSDDPWDNLWEKLRVTDADGITRELTLGETDRLKASSMVPYRFLVGEVSL